MSRSSAYYQLTPPVTIALLVLLILAASSPNPGVTLAAVLLIPIFMCLLWRKAEPPILLFATMMQWLQASTRVFQANLLNIHTNQISDTDQIEKAIWLSLSGLLALAVGMRLGMRGMPKADEKQASLELSRVNIGKIWAAYLILFALSSLGRVVAFKIPGLTQVILSFLSLRWTAFFILAAYIIYFKRNSRYLFMAVALEVVVGITGFFGGFKEVFFVLIVALLTKDYRLKPKAVVLFFVYTAVLFNLTIVWTSVKMDYREYLSQGARQQIIRVPFKQRVIKMYTLITEMDGDRFRRGITDTADRISQVDIFAYTLERVPSILPYENGKLWFRAIRHIFVPRLLYPNKPPLPSDSVVTSYYTGRDYAGAEEGTSIAIGYPAESYIDFGPWGMLLPMFAIGLICGMIYNFFVTNAREKIIGYAFSVAVLMRMYKLEVDNVHLLGGIVTVFIVFVLIMKYAVPKFRALIFNADE